MTDTMIEEIYLGDMFDDFFAEMISEEDVLVGMQAIGKVLGKLGYELISGKVAEGKASELWARRVDVVEEPRDIAEHALQGMTDAEVEPFDRPARRRAPDHDSMGPEK